MSRINATTEQSGQIDQLKSYVEDYCQQNGIDPKVYTSYLDNKKTGLDPAIVNDPVFQAYWQLSYLQLNEIINPVPLQSMSSEVGDVDFDALYSAVASSSSDLVHHILGGDPELISTHSSEVTPQELLKNINQKAPAPEQVFSKEGSIKGVTKSQVGAGNVFDWLQDTQDGIESVEQWAMGGLADVDAYVASLQEMIQSGKIDPQKADILSKEALASRETYVLFMQQSQTRMNQILEMFSALLKAVRDQQNSVSRNVNYS